MTALLLLLLIPILIAAYVLAESKLASGGGYSLTRRKETK